MSEETLILSQRTATGKKLKALRADGKIPSVVYGQNLEPVLTVSDYNPTEKVLTKVGYHSTLDLEIDGKRQLAIVKNIGIDPVSRRIVNVEFQAVSASQIVEATAPIVLVDYEGSPASKAHLAITQVMEEIAVKAKPSDLPEELKIDASQLTTVDDKITIADIQLPAGVELADKTLATDQVVASLYDPAVESAQREAKEETAEESAAAETEATETNKE